MKIVQLCGMSIVATCLLLSGNACAHADAEGQHRVASLPVEWTDALDAKIASLSAIEPLEARFSALIRIAHSLLLDTSMTEEERLALALRSVEKVVQILDEEVTTLTAQWDVTDEESLARREIEKKFTSLTLIRTTLASLATLPYSDAINKVEKMLQTLPAVEVPGDCGATEEQGIYSQTMKDTLHSVDQSADHLDSTASRAKTIVAASSVLLGAVLGICVYFK
jgi:hypothetical protein